MSKLLFFVSGLFCVHGWFPAEYPSYCTKDVSAREIPPLTAEQSIKVSTLKQLQVMIRHGARTPYQKYTCWNNYDVSWNNCNVTELMLPSPSYTSQVRPSTWLFRKVFDGSDNFLGGNCLTGQLLGEGYKQEEANGKYLSAAYLQNTNPLLNLFPTNQWEDINTDSEIYLRGDDQERTLLSGQTLLHTFFNVSEETIIDWHTGDYDLDQLYPNSAVCPRLSTLEKSIKLTPEYIAYNTSTRMNTLNDQLDDILGGWTWSYIFDCFMTTVCTDREVPSGSEEQGALMDQTIFNNTIEQVEFTYAYVSLYNDSQWAKLAMGNVAWHIRTNLENAINNQAHQKLVLFSGHDTTIMPFLASILKQNWDAHWAGYASMVTIELYESAADPDSLDPSDDLFRIVYNGVPQTVPGCDDTLCKASVLLEALSFGEEKMSCSVPATPDAASDDQESETCTQKSSLSDLDWILLLVLALALGVVVGVAVVIFVDKRKAFLSSGGGVMMDSTHHGSVQGYDKVNTFGSPLMDGADA